MSHKDLIDRLVLAATMAMEEIQLEQGFEDRVLLSAVYTLALRATDNAIANNEALRGPCLQGSQLLLMRCAGGVRPN